MRNRTPSPVVRRSNVRLRFLPLLPLAALAAFACAKEPPATVRATDAGAAPVHATTDDGSAATIVADGDAGAAPAGYPETPPHEGSALAFARSGDWLYVADEDHSVLRVVAKPEIPDAGSPRPRDAGVQRLASKEIAMPGRPANVVALAGRIVVTVRDPGVLVVLDATVPDAPTISAKIELPADAWGVAVSPDEKLALVTSAWTHQVSLVDVAGGKKLWSIDVAREPRGVVFRGDGKSAYVSHLTSSRITRLDFAPEGGEPKKRDVKLPVAPLRAASELEASLGYALVLSPDKRRLFAPRHALGAMGDEAWFGTTTVDVLLTADDTPLSPARARGTATTASASVPERMIDHDAGPFALAALDQFAEPRAAVYSKSTDTLLVLSEGLNRIAELRGRAIDPSLHWLSDRSFQCGAASGLALSPDESTAYVFCRAPYAVVACPTRGRDGVQTRSCAPPLVVADDTLPPLAAKGRALFHDANDSDVSGGVACAGCHPEGRDDAHVWHEIETKDAPFELPSGVEPRVFVGASETADVNGFPRQTPMLAGRVKADGPYGWRAENPDLESRIQEGMHLHRWNAATYDEKVMNARADALVAFLRSGLVPPPRPEHVLTAEEQRGKTIFESAETACATCHAPSSEFTDRAPHKLVPWPTAKGFDAEESTGFKPPSLFFVAGTAPYYHDGSAQTLEQLVAENKDRMGKTSQLSAADRAALVAYLRTL